MRHPILLVTLCCICSLPALGNTYFLSSSGLDSNNGTSSETPWLTPNHPLNCGDTITAAAGASYVASSFASGEWGTVTCPAGNNVVWLQCVTFDACKIRVTTGTLDGMRVSASYWGVQGWEVDNTSTNAGGGSCFTAVPPTRATNIHHIIFANNVADVCPLGGFGSGNNVTAGVDYIEIVGNLSYGAGTSNTYCGSNISVYEPVASDTLPGTHIYVGGNFAIASTNPSGCYDGNGIIFDTFDGDQQPMVQSYAYQSVIDNNIALANGGVGVRMEYNNAGPGPTHAKLYARHNTAWGNSNGSYQYGNPTCGDFQIYDMVNAEVFQNIASTNQVGCYGFAANPLYAFETYNADGTSHIYQNIGWSATGTYDQIITSGEFAYDPDNVFGTNPGFANPATPGAPNCASASSVPNCMATVIANFKPLAPAAQSFGYQTPSTTSIYDPLFPQWLCNVNLPPGLVTMGCLQLHLAVQVF